MKINNFKLTGIPDHIYGLYIAILKFGVQITGFSYDEASNCNVLEFYIPRNMPYSTYSMHLWTENGTPKWSYVMPDGCVMSE